jgi:crossover junction endodeoxyribonuclease RuvC
VRIVGIDPGASGALALTEKGEILSIVDMPVVVLRRGKTDKREVDGGLVAEWMGFHEPDVVVIERVGGMTGQSASAAFNFGRACGVVEGVARALRLRVEFVSPVTWRNGLKVNPGKDGSRAMAMNLWPAKADLFKRVKDDGRAEAALIAEWFRRHGQ